ncbi:MAG: acetyl-CoA carboxylase, biotin carboxyl carrier protein, partial [Pseudomonadota bacterium]
MALSYAEVAEILAIVDGSDLEELVLEIGETRLVVRKGAGSGSAGAAPVEARPTAAATHAPPTPPHAPPQPRAEPAEPGAVPVVSPMVGRLYRRPSPDEPPF